MVGWSGPCWRSSGEDKTPAVLVSGDLFCKKEELCPPNLVRIGKGCQKEAFLLLREIPSALLSVVNAEEGSLIDELLYMS